MLLKWMREFEYMNDDMCEKCVCELSVDVNIDDEIDLISD